MKRLVIVFSFLAVFSNAYAGPMIEVYTCELNEGKTLVDANEMVANFAEMLEEAGLQDSYTAHLGFQQLPARANSVNWVGISPSPEDFGKTIELSLIHI